MRSTVRGIGGNELQLSSTAVACRRRPTAQHSVYLPCSVRSRDRLVVRVTRHSSCRKIPSLCDLRKRPVFPTSALDKKSSRNEDGEDAQNWIREGLEP